MNATANQTVLDDSMLDIDLDTVEDLPPMEVPPNGAYLLKLSTELRDINGKAAISLNYEVIATNEKSNPAEEDAKPGTKFNELCMLPTGLPYHKEKLVVLGEALGTKNVREIVAAVKELQITATVKRRILPAKEEGGEPRVFGAVSNLAVA